MSPLQNDTERPSAIVCIAYRQISTMTGVKDPTEPPKKVEEVKPENQNNAVIKLGIADFQIQSMQSILDFSRDMAESLRLFIEDLKARIEQFREQKESILDLFSIEKWTQREQ
ncbi:uncharacterized protein LOC143181170 [Calliopsis andreniformis]|uniref:uncharacterized protein LOC143181170 n=1 Tax=Calliopsis andreniformis TaxID=337506 RepID=UPI003FCD516D